MTQHMGESGHLSGPYIWHTKDQEPLETKRSVQRLWATPYFVNFSRSNVWVSSESFELWFAMAGGGAMAHADSYCDMTVSLQLKGSKRWRLMMLPPLNSANDLFNTHDGFVYEKGLWAPEYEACTQLSGGAPTSTLPFHRPPDSTGVLASSSAWRVLAD